MTQQTLELGERLRDEGIDRSINHADRVEFDWSKGAYQLVSTMSGSFTSEEVRQKADRIGFPSPPDARAWGGVMRRAKHNGLINFEGYQPSINPQAHRRPTSVWSRS